MKNKANRVMKGERSMYGEKDGRKEDGKERKQRRGGEVKEMGKVKGR
jgi:hypothetical protein